MTTLRFQLKSFGAHANQLDSISKSLDCIQNNWISYILFKINKIPKQSQGFHKNHWHAMKILRTQFKSKRLHKGHYNV